jgi:hypothetical protein
MERVTKRGKVNEGARDKIANLGTDVTQVKNGRPFSLNRTNGPRPLIFVPFRVSSLLLKLVYFIALSTMEGRYPRDGSEYMNKNGPADPRFRIPCGKLLYNPKRDARFPYIYEISTHMQVHSPQHITKILIHIVDTSVEARMARAKFEKTLSVPLGPNALMEKYGQYLPRPNGCDY